MNHAVQWSDLWPSSIACAVQSPRSFAFSLLSSTALLNTLQKFSCVLWIGWNIGSFSITDGFSPNGLPFQLVQPLHPSRPLLLLSSCLDHIIRIWTRKNKKLKVGWFYLFFFFHFAWLVKKTHHRTGSDACTEFPMQPTKAGLFAKGFTVWNTCYTDEWCYF